MTENTAYNRKKFLQQYGLFIVIDKVDNYVLELYDVQGISEKESQENFKKSRIWVLENFVEKDVTEKLRELGYATPYKDLCVQKLIDYGWICKK